MNLERMEELLFYRNLLETDFVQDLKADAPYAALSRLFQNYSNMPKGTNLWHIFLSDFLLQDENSLSLSAEKRGWSHFSHPEFIQREMEILYSLYHLNLSFFFPKEQKAIDSVFRGKVSEAAKTEHFPSYSYEAQLLSFNNKLETAKDAQEFSSILEMEYKEKGVGLFRCHSAFSLEKESIFGTSSSEYCLEGLPLQKYPGFSTLLGYEKEISALKENTEAFLAGKKANHVLLYGDAGTGKSSCMKALLEEYQSKGLRFVSLFKKDLEGIPFLLQALRERPYFFILYFDDLSFENFEVEYKLLKAVMEGGLEGRADNILLYATSNRRHLVKENLSDKNDIEYQEDLHHSDTTEEKLSLADRFGLSILFQKPAYTLYQKIVLSLANKYKLSISEEKLLTMANAWSIRRGAATGRTAEQFIQSLLVQKKD